MSLPEGRRIWTMIAFAAALLGAHRLLALSAKTLHLLTKVKQLSLPADGLNYCKTVNMAISHAFITLEAEVTMLKKVFLLSTTAVFTLGLAACDVDKTKDGDVQMPKYEVEKTQEGNVDLPKVDVTPPDVDVKKEEKTVEVPTVKTEEKKITVPDVDITPAKDK